jgi:hypothetical protein
MLAEPGGADVPEVPSPEIMRLAAEIENAAKLADRGNQKALVVTGQLFDKFPVLWDDYGNLASAAEGALVDLYAGQRVLTREALRKRLAEMRARLAGPEASPLDGAIDHHDPTVLRETRRWTCRAAR